MREGGDRNGNEETTTHEEEETPGVVRAEER